MSAQLPEGTRVRLTGRSRSGDAELDEQAASTSSEYEVFSFAEGAQGDDPNGRDYYLLDKPGMSYGGNYWAYPEHLQVSMTVEQLAARRPPSVNEVRSAVGSALHGMRVVDVDETQHEDEDRLLAIGRTDDGLHVSFVVTISEIEEADE